MSDMVLRDDDQDNMFATDSLRVGLGGSYSDSLRIADILSVGAFVSADERFGIMDGNGSDTALNAADSVSAVDYVDLSANGYAAVSEWLRVSDSAVAPHFQVSGDTVRLRDTLTESGGRGYGDSALVSDLFLSSGVFRADFDDVLTVSDSVQPLFLSSVTDSVSVSDSALSAAAMLSAVSDGLNIADGYGSSGGNRINADDAVKISDGLLTVLSGKSSVSDVLEIDDTALRDESERRNVRAWTANTDSWAVSQYLLSGWNDLAVIDGKLYGFADDGVYVLDSDAEEMTAFVETGLEDVGGGILVHPVAAYAEYALQGTAEMAVTELQSGKLKTYRYRLPKETAESLTNGRFIFGRGLRGRHFKFELVLSGVSAHVYDWRVDVNPTKRRV